MIMMGHLLITVLFTDFTSIYGNPFIEELPSNSLSRCLKVDLFLTWRFSKDRPLAQFSSITSNSEFSYIKEAIT